MLHANNPENYSQYDEQEEPSYPAHLQAYMDAVAELCMKTGTSWGECYDLTAEEFFHEAHSVGMNVRWESAVLFVNDVQLTGL